MDKPKLLDLFCCAGGCSTGYTRAGFDVTGIDINPQPNYPYTFIQADALEVLADRAFLDQFDAIAASPPCQHYSPLTALSPDKTYPDLIAPTRQALMAWGGPYVIENVMTAPLLKAESIVLCGSMFGLRTYRHRRFELSPDLAHIAAPPHPKHVARTATKQRRQRWAEGWNVSITGDVGTYLARDAMGIDWKVSGNELCEAIPPAYTEWIGKGLLQGARYGATA